MSASDPPATVAQARPAIGTTFFCGEGLHKRFGGVHAVRDISLNVPHGDVFAIIGPNGAGKSTLLNLMSGLYQPDAGRMVFDGVDLVGLPAHKRVRLGLARTLAASLAYGEQRMLELARALATAPRLLMLDEPAAGLNAAEVERLLERIRLLREGGMTIIVVEHNMDLVMKIADRVLVMDYGQHLFEGTPAQVQANPTVIAAYLGA
jgi:branched-chain amino acid transport system ATP-binding protein